MSRAERLFIAVPTSESLKQSLRELQLGLAEILEEYSITHRTENIDNSHLTIRFLGDTPIDKVKGLDAVLLSGELGVRGFDAQLAQLGSFGGLRKARVLWVGLEPLSEFQVLKSELERILAPLGLTEEESRTFTPHLTLFRLRGAQDLRSVWSELRSVDVPAATLRVNELVLYKSELSSHGATHVKRVSRSF